MTVTAEELVRLAMRNAQKANEAMNQIDQAALPVGVWDVLYAQNEAIGQLATSLLWLCEPEAQR